MNNPFVMLAQLVQSGGNPTAMISRMAQQNPQIAQSMQMLSGRRPQELQQIAQNLAQQKGIDLNTVIRGLGIR